MTVVSHLNDQNNFPLCRDNYLTCFFPKIGQFYIGLVNFFSLRKSFVNRLFDYTSYGNLKLSKYSHHVKIIEEITFKWSK